MKVEVHCPTRVDLAGGTLDIHPLPLLFPHTRTCNLSISLKASVSITDDGPEDGILIISKDYQSEILYSPSNTPECFHGPFELVLRIVSYFLKGVSTGVKITIGSGAPPSSGLGGSSVMAIALAKACTEFSKQAPLGPYALIKIVQNIEAVVLASGPTGIQDYFPPVLGGILGLSYELSGPKAEQLYDEKLAAELEDRITLVYSGLPHHSGMNNWEVYSSYFNKDSPELSKGLEALSDISHEMYQALKKRDLKRVIKALRLEGAERVKSFPTMDIPDLAQSRRELTELGLSDKICGAGGGGCYLLVHEKGERAKAVSFAKRKGHRPLDFLITPPMRLNHE